MKSLIDYICESADIKTAAAFKKDIDLKIPSGLKFKNGVGIVKVDYKKYNDFVKGFKYLIRNRYPDMKFLGSLKDESGLYSLDGGESISGDFADYSDFIIHVESGNIYLFREIVLTKEVYVVFKLIDNPAKEPMIKAKEVTDKLEQMLPYNMEPAEVMKKYFKINEVGPAKAKFPGADKDILAEIKEDGEYFSLYINGEKKVTNNTAGITLKLSGNQIKNYLMDVVIEWYKKQIK